MKFEKKTLFSLGWKFDFQKRQKLEVGILFFEKTKQKTQTFSEEKIPEEKKNTGQMCVCECVCGMKIGRHTKYTQGSC